MRIPGPAIGRTVGVVLLALGAGALAGCSQSDDERRAAYCEDVEEASPRLTRLADEGGPGAFIEALPVLEELVENAPSDIKQEWRSLIDALHGLEDAVQETGLDPGDVKMDPDGGLPEDLSAEDRRRITGAASVLASPEVTSATVGIEQHALDVCGTPLL